ncbi:MAG: hypothetical protein RMJ18_01515 [Candidatus Aenigmarchaeota archaeon]|nr:hypothetical protein [Candidatus Aenigmarchaeota archaeon]MCX8190572.1 hypothetical protein [Candidatus Aenigmarchaeota archaeon]MDW8160080.1 hypothetical protein [Candidatus Aenigmarchaeota archaeon]
MVKAQAFLLASVVISVALVMMYTPMRNEYLAKSTQILKQEYESKIFENVYNEIKNVVYFSFQNYNTCVRNTLDFLNFTDRYVRGKSLRFSGVLILANISTQLNLTVINFLEDRVKINIVLNGASFYDLTVENRGINATILSPSPGRNNMTLIYNDVNRVVFFEDSDRFFYLIDVKIEGEEFSKRMVEAFVFD